MLLYNLLVRGLNPLKPVTIKKEVIKTSRKSEKDSRKKFVKFRVSNEEYNAIESKFRNSGLKSRSDFIGTMIFEGCIVHFNEEKFDKIYKLIGNISNNINQIAIRVNSTGKIYAEDIAQIQEGINQIWQRLNFFQSKLLRLKH